MKSSLKQIKRVGLAWAALGSIAFSQQSLAAGTAAGTTIQNTATVNYQVGGVSQAAINSNNAQFVVDNKVNLTVERLDGTAVTVTPGGTGFVTAYRLTNTGNKPQGFIFNGDSTGAGNANTSTGTADPFGGTVTDSFEMLGTGTYVESTAGCSSSTGAPGYAAASDTARNVVSLAPDACVYVYIVAAADTIANGASNGALSVVQLSAQARVATTLAQLNETTGADTAGEDIVFADTGRDAIESVNSAYVVSSAALAVAKSSVVVYDPINTSNFKAIPGAIVEYTVKLTNSGSSNATGVVITDTLPTNGVTFHAGQYNAGASDVSIQVGNGSPTYCVAEAGSDGNGDGCFRTAGGVLTVGAPAITQVATGGASTELSVSFRMRITP
jgi:uncharacterized repeat protein (TIGR01451 family)